jgi:hypothetical protein
MNKDAYFFSHDSNASNDPDIICMRQHYGWEGYGLYWAIVERLRDMSEYKYPLDRLATLAYDLRYDDIQTFINDCVDKFNLLESDDNFFWSGSLCRRMQVLADSREKRSNAAKKRWSCNADASSNAMHMQSKAVKESKVKNSKEKHVVTAEPPPDGDNPVIPQDKIPDRYAPAADIIRSEFGIDLRMADIDLLDDLFQNNYPSTVYAQIRKLRKKCDESTKPPPENPIAYIHSYMRNWKKKTGGKKDHAQVGQVSWKCPHCGAQQNHSETVCFSCKKDRSDR